MHIKVRVKAGARRERVEELSENRFEVAVREEAEHGAANERVLTLLAARLGLHVSRLRIVKGHHSPSKLVEVGQQPPLV